MKTIHPSTTPPHFSLQSAGRSWGTRIALQDISLEIQPGERIAIIGPSGGGKSTFIRLLAGALRPSSGQVLVDDHSLQSLSRRELQKHRRRCGIVEQSLLLISQLSVHRNVLAGLLPHWSWMRILLSMLWPIEGKLVAKYLKQVGLEERQWDSVSQLSGGQQQRVAIARALIGQPDVVLADEPTASLDPTTAAEVTDLLLTHGQEHGATLVICTHWFSLVQPRVDRVLGIREGKILIDAPAEDVDEVALQALYAGSDERR